jgi:hypothetical protein
MKWEKPSQAIVETFEKSLPWDERIERKTMFGMPCAFVNGNMFCGVFMKGIMVRLGPGQRENWIKQRNAKLFEPMPGKPMKEYIEPPATLLKNDSQLRALITESFEFALSLPPKLKKKAAPKKKGKGEK